MGISAITSTSTRTPRGRADTATQERAGLLAVKYCEYTSLNAAKLSMLVKKQVAFTTFEKSVPAAVSTAAILRMTCSVCSFMPPDTTAPVSGNKGI